MGALAVAAAGCWVGCVGALAVATAGCWVGYVGALAELGFWRALTRPVPPYWRFS